MPAPAPVANGAGSSKAAAAAGRTPFRGKGSGKSLEGTKPKAASKSPAATPAATPAKRKLVVSYKEEGEVSGEGSDS